MMLEHLHRKICLTLPVVLLLSRLFAPTDAGAQMPPSIMGAVESEVGQITLAWDPNKEENLAGYKLHYGIVSGEYSETVDVGNVTQYTLNDIVRGQKYFYVATAYNTEGNESDYSNEISHTIPEIEEPLPDAARGWGYTYQCATEQPPIEVIVDNGDPGTSFIGTWKPSAGANFYGNNSLYIWEGPAYRYTYQSGIVGKTKVDAWWTNRPTRCRAVPIEIWDQENLLATVPVDQLVNGGQWNYLGEYTFTGKARVVVRAQSPDCSTCADAVKFWRE